MQTGREVESDRKLQHWGNRDFYTGHMIDDWQVEVTVVTSPGILGQNKLQKKQTQLILYPHYVLSEGKKSHVIPLAESSPTFTCWWIGFKMGFIFLVLEITIKTKKTTSDTSCLNYSLYSYKSQIQTTHYALSAPISIHAHVWFACRQNNPKNLQFTFFLSLCV